MVGSDYPFDMASSDPVGGVEVVDMTDDERAKVLERTALSFLRPLRGNRGEPNPAHR
jgi:hypothetical protein